MNHGKSLASCGLLLLTTSTIYGCGGGEGASSQPLTTDGLSNITQDNLSIVGATNNVNLYPAALSQLALSAINSLGTKNSFSVPCGAEASDRATITIQRQTPGEFSSNDTINLSLVNCFTTLMDATALSGNISIDVSHISYGPVVTELNAVLSYPSLLNQLDNGEGYLNVPLSGEHSLEYTFANDIQQIHTFQNASQYTNLGNFFLLTDAEVSQTHDLISSTTAMDMQGKVKWSGNGSTLSYEVTTPETLEGVLGWGFNSGKLVINGANEQMVEFSANDEPLLPSGSIAIFDTYIKGLDINESLVLGDIFGGDVVQQPVLHSNIFSHIPELWNWSEDNVGIHTGMLYSDGTLESYQKTAQGLFDLPHYRDFPADGSFTVYAKDLSLNAVPTEVDFAIVDEYAGFVSVNVTRVGYRYTITPAAPLVPGKTYQLTSSIDGQYPIATFTVAGSYDPSDLSITMPDDRFVTSGESFVMSPIIIGYYEWLSWEDNTYSASDWWANDIAVTESNNFNANVTVTGEAGQLASLSLTVYSLDSSILRNFTTVQIADSDKDKSYLQITEYQNVQPQLSSKLLIGEIREMEDSSSRTIFVSRTPDSTNYLRFEVTNGTIIDSENISYSWASMTYTDHNYDEYNLLEDCTVDRVEFKDSIGLVSGTRTDFTIHCNQESGFIKGFVHNFYE